MTSVMKRVLVIQEAIIFMYVKDKNDMWKWKLKEVAKKLQESKDELEIETKAIKNKGRSSQKRGADQSKKR